MPYFFVFFHTYHNPCWHYKDIRLLHAGFLQIIYIIRIFEDLMPFLYYRAHTIIGCLLGQSSESVNLRLSPSSFCRAFCFSAFFRCPVFFFGILDSVSLHNRDNFVVKLEVYLALNAV